MFSSRRVAALAVSAVVLLSGCTSFAEPAPEAAPAPAPSAVAAAAPSPSAEPVPPVVFSTSVLPASVVGLDAPVAGSVVGGSLVSVQLVPHVPSEGVVPVEAVVSPDRLSWSVPAFALVPHEGYRVVVEATNVDGERRVSTTSFSTGAPSLVQTPSVSPLQDALVGVGYPIVVTFDHVVRDKAVVEQNMHVTASNPIGPAEWYWTSDTQVVFRPQGYWPANTRVDVNLDLGGVRTGEAAWVMEDRNISFQVGRSRVMRIDDSTHHMQVFDDGELVKTVPVSMGKDTKETYVTRSGTKVVMTRERTRRMTSESAGITEEEYDLVVEYALRLTNSGEFFHSAPWSVGSQGKRNVSHGCVNLSPANARWLYETSMVGDPVETVGTGRQMESYNGLGGVWNIPWETWAAPQS